MTFNKKHINKTVQKTEKTEKALTSFKPNLGGAGAPKQNDEFSVTSAWHTVTTIKKMMQKLTSPKRKLAMRKCRSYRTITLTAVNVGIPSIEQQMIERNERFMGLVK